MPKTLNIAAVLLLNLTTAIGCAGTFGAGSDQGRRIADVEKQDVAGTALPSVPVTAAQRYQTHRLAALNQCKTAESRLDGFALQLKTSSARRTLVGGVLTAVFGAGGSVATAVASSQQSVAGSGPDINGQDATTVMGAVTAGVTAVTGAVALAIVGPPPADKLTAIDNATKKVLNEWSSFDSRCPVGPSDPTKPWTDPVYNTCSAAADEAATACTTALTSANLVVKPYTPPVDPPLVTPVPATSATATTTSTSSAPPGTTQPPVTPLPGSQPQ